MKRSIANAVEQYENLITVFRETGSATKGALYPSDIEQVVDLATKKGGKVDLMDAIGIALEAGFSIGYRAGVKDGLMR